MISPVRWHTLWERIWLLLLLLLKLCLILLWFRYHHIDQYIVCLMYIYIYTVSFANHRAFSIESLLLLLLSFLWWLKASIHISLLWLDGRDCNISTWRFALKHVQFSNWSIQTKCDFAQFTRSTIYRMAAIIVHIVLFYFPFFLSTVASVFSLPWTYFRSNFLSIIMVLPFF